MEFSNLMIIKTKIVKTAKEIANFINFLIKETIITSKITDRIILPSRGRLSKNKKNF